MRPIAIVMNMFYTGLGIARSLGEQGIPVIGLTARRGAYGNFTRYAKMQRCPDSRHAPEALLTFLLNFGKELRQPAIIFPTRDDDVLFLDRFRQELQRYFILVLPESGPLDACLNKWKTHQAAIAAGVPSPRTWQIGSRQELLDILPDVIYPCVMKPVFAQDWRKAHNWELVGQRKAVGVHSAEELLAEYDSVAQAESRALLQEMIPGGDDRLWIAACYMDRSSKLAAGFTAQKLVQVPEGFGTGCIVQTVNRPDLLDVAGRLLERLGFTGIAEVEFKVDASGQYKLIEINPRPWDQHRLGKACGVDLIYTAYCDLAGLPAPAVNRQTATQKWIAEDVFVFTLLRSAWRRDGRCGKWLRLAQGRRVYAVSSLADPLPFLGFLLTGFIPDMASSVLRIIASRLRRLLNRRAPAASALHYENQLRNAKNNT